MKRKKTANKEIKKAISDSGVEITDSIVSLFTVIPPIRTIHSIRNIYFTIKEQLFYEKLSIYLQETSTVTEKERNLFLKKLDNDTDFFKALFVVIDKLEEKEKAGFIGNLARALFKDQISKEDFLRLCLVIDRLHLSDLKQFYKWAIKGKTDNVDEVGNYHVHKYYWKNNKDIAGLEGNLFSVGLLQKLIEDPDITGGSRFKLVEEKDVYELTNLGRVLREYGFNKEL